MTQLVFFLAAITETQFLPFCLPEASHGSWPHYHDIGVLFHMPFSDFDSDSPASSDKNSGSYINLLVTAGPSPIS